MHTAISVRAPLRIALGGGGTDLPSHYREHGGFVVSAAIDRHVHMRVSEPADGRYVLEHLEREEVERVEHIGHPILRAAFVRHARERPVRLESSGDVEPGTGLGSSGAYTVAAVKALTELAGQPLEPQDLAAEACRIEIEDLDRTVGKQDQYAAALGGLNALTFERDDTVRVERIEPGPELSEALRDRFLLFFTGGSRSAADVLAGQVQRTAAGDRELHRNLTLTMEAARAARTALEADDLDALAELMNEGWRLKSERLAHIPMDRIELLRSTVLSAGGRGAMLMGAGGGGFLLAYAPDPEPVRAAMEQAGAPELRFDVDRGGCRTVAE